MPERAARLAGLALLAAAACGESGGKTAPLGQAPSSSAPAVALSAPLTADITPDVDDLDGGLLGGLEFDPSSRRLIMPDGPPRPRPLRPGTALPIDQLLRDELVGVAFVATFRPRDVPEPAKTPEVNAPGIDAAKKLTAPTVAVTATAHGRMKIVFQSRALPLPFRSEVRARFDRLGHLVFWPGLDRYRVLAPGALRTTLGERRVDVTPLVPGTKGKTGTGKLLDLPTRTVVLESSLARVRLETANVPESGLGGPLFCRAVVEIGGIDPSTSECKPEEVLLSASIDWLDGGGFDVDVSALERRGDLAPGEVMVPPPASTAADDGLPEAPDGIYLTKDELANFRSRPTDPKPAAAGAPAEGLAAQNGRDYLMILLLDGVPVAGVPPLGDRYVIGPLRGTYVVQWRTFFGEEIDPPTTVELPAVVRSVEPPTQADAGK